VRTFAHVEPTACLLWVGFAFPGGYVLYWFNAPLRGIVASTAPYVSAWVVAWT
jgi:hypothetical protein